MGKVVANPGMVDSLNSKIEDYGTNHFLLKTGVSVTSNAFGSIQITDIGLPANAELVRVTGCTYPYSVLTGGPYLRLIDASVATNVAVANKAVTIAYLYIQK